MADTYPFEYFLANGEATSNPLGAATCQLQPSVGTSVTAFIWTYWGVGLAILAYGGYHLNLAKKEAARLAAAGSPKPATKGAPDKNNMLWIILNVTANIGVVVTLANYQLKNFSPVEVSVINNANSYLLPMRNIFAFFEDGILVKLSNVLGAGKTMEANNLLRWGLIGSFAAGVVGAFLSWGITFATPIYTFFLPATSGQDVIGLEYWNFTAFTWPAIFVQSVLIGTIIAAGRASQWLLATILCAALNLGIFFGTENILTHLGSLGLSSMVSTYFFIAFVYWRFNKSSFFGASADDLGEGAMTSSLFSSEALGVAYRALLDGALLMVKDLVLTVQNSATNILASKLGYGQQYRLVIFKTIEQNYGLVPGAITGSCFSIVLGYTIKVAGARLIGERQRAAFVWLCNIVIKGSVMFAALSMALLIIFRNSIPYYFGSKTLCMLNTSYFTIPTYQAIFGPDFETAFIVNAIGVAIDIIQFQLSSSLYAMLDLKYLGYSTAINGLLVYLPLNLCALFLSPSASASILYYQYAAVIANFTLTVVYALRVRKMTREMTIEDHEYSVPLVYTEQMTPRTEHLLRTA